MSTRSMMAAAVVAAAMAAAAAPATAASRHGGRHHVRALTITRSRGLPVPPDPLAAATPNLTGSNGVTTDTNVLYDGSVGDGFYGFQTPGLDSYGLAGGGLTPYQLQ